MSKIRAGVVGAAGYTGGEALRLLVNHPEVDLTFAHSRSNAGKRIDGIHGDLLGETDLHFSDSVSDADVVFLCLGHGESREFLEKTRIAETTKIVDLSQDFRLGDTPPDRKFVYGLPEFQREAIKQASSIANPGCFATALQVGLLPLAAKGILGEVFSTGITGSTGAGQRLQQTTHFTWRANNISPYKTLTHQHLKEVTMTLKALQPGFKDAINFIPWRGDFTRGILVSSCVTSKLPSDEVTQLYDQFYAPHPFTHVCKDVIDLKQVVNTNKCLVYLEKQEDKLVIHTAIDNLLKGASGQAVQNMNLMFGLEETLGLRLKGIAF